MSGIVSAENSTSTTGPMTRATRPVFAVAPAPETALSVVAVMMALTRFRRVSSASALAPPTISLISWVISACRALLASLVSTSIRSLALSVADFIARRLAAISAAADSSRAWYSRFSTYHGSSASSTASADGSNSYRLKPPGGASVVSSISSGRMPADRPGAG